VKKQREIEIFEQKKKGKGGKKVGTPSKAKKARSTQLMRTMVALGKTVGIKGKKKEKKTLPFFKL
jgi:hypothetical protein